MVWKWSLLLPEPWKRCLCWQNVHPTKFGWDGARGQLSVAQGRGRTVAVDLQTLLDLVPRSQPTNCPWGRIFPPETCPNGLPVGSWPTPEPWSLDPPEAWSPDSSETTYCKTSSVKLLNPWVRWDQTRRKQLQDKKSEDPSGCWYEVPTFQCKQAPDQPGPMQEPWPHKATWNVVGTTEEPNDTF